MLTNLFESIRDGMRHRFGRQLTDGHATISDEDREALHQYNDAEARVVGRTMGEPNELRAFGKGRPR